MKEILDSCSENDMKKEKFSRLKTFLLSFITPLLLFFILFRKK